MLQLLKYLNLLGLLVAVEFLQPLELFPDAEKALLFLFLLLQLSLLLLPQPFLLEPLLFGQQVLELALQVEAAALEALLLLADRS